VFGYFYGSDYREVELLIRGSERLSTLDSRKEHSLVERQADVLKTLLCMLRADLQGAQALPAIEAMRAIANMAATPIPSIPYELLHTHKAHACIHRTLKQLPRARQAALVALVGLLKGSRLPGKRLILGEGSEGLASTVLGLLVGPEDLDLAVREILVVALRHLLAAYEACRCMDRMRGVLEAQATAPTDLLAAVLSVLRSSRSLDVLYAAMALLSDLVRAWPVAGEALRKGKEQLLGALEAQLSRAPGQEEALTGVVGQAVVLLVQGLGAELEDARMGKLLQHVSSTPVLARLGPFRLLRHGRGRLPPTLESHLLRASTALLREQPDPTAALELAVLEDALEVYLAPLQQAVGTATPDKQGQGQGLPQLEGLASALEGLRALEEATGAAEMHEEITRRGVPDLLGKVLGMLRQGGAGAGADHTALGPVATALMSLMEVWLAREEMYAAIGGGADGEEQEGTNDVEEEDEDDEELRLHAEDLEVSSGARSKVNLLQRHPTSCWQTSDRVALDGLLLEDGRRVQRPDSHGHFLTVKLPAPIPSPGAPAALEGQGQGQAGPPSWRLQMRRGLTGSSAPCEVWVLAAEREGGAWAVVRKQLMGEGHEAARSWSTLLSRADLAPFPGASSVRIEVYHAAAGWRINGLRFKAGGAEEGLPPETLTAASITSFLRSVCDVIHLHLVVAVCTSWLDVLQGLARQRSRLLGAVPVGFAAAHQRQGVGRAPTAPRPEP
jgi:hypothetical protein